MGFACNCVILCSVTIVIHSAATVKFTEKIKYDQIPLVIHAFSALTLHSFYPHALLSVTSLNSLRLAVDLNVKGVRSVIDLCHAIKDLKCFLHISTAYAHTNRSVQHHTVPSLP